MQTQDIRLQQNVFTVSRLNHSARLLLEQNFPSIMVEGEISNFSAPHSGHWYFSLKDSQAQISCAMFKGQQRSLSLMPKDGMHVLLKGRLTLYENSGRYQIIADDIEEIGEGKLRRAFEDLKKKLGAAGLFEQAHKKLLPPYPTTIGVITSATGAAIRDILTVLNRRFAGVAIIIYPSLVQGANASASLVQAIRVANQRQECDILILARGGGSLEDLWPFNEEILAYAIYESKIPIVSAVGHEIDFTISDFVADVRAPTPSAAAEIAVPDKEDLLQLLSSQYLNLSRQIKVKLNHLKQQLAWQHKCLWQYHPSRKLAENAQLLDFHQIQLIRLAKQFIHRLQIQLHDYRLRLQSCNPSHRLNAMNNQVAHLFLRLEQSMAALIHRHVASLNRLSATLDALSPLATLGRGYALALNSNEQIIQEATQTTPGERLKILLKRGSLKVKVEKIESLSYDPTLIK